MPRTLKQKNSLNKADVIKYVAKDCNYKHYEVEDVVNSLLRVFTDMLHAGYEIRLPDFGVISTGVQAERYLNDIKTKQPRFVPAKIKVKFKASSTLTEKINEPRYSV